jgi:tetracycline 7-halogenase / FADH2 O2-dependent halogenase
LRMADGAQAWQRLLDLIPALQSQFADANAERPFVHMQRLPFCSSAIAGRRWALLPSAAGFVDPLLSTGFPLTLLGVSRIADAIEHDWKSSRFSEGLRAYSELTHHELLATARLIGALYANMNNFDVFVALALLYFAAASFSEAARRLGKPQLASSFLLCNHPVFGPACRRLCERASQHESGGLIQDILRTIEPFNVAGLGKQDRRNWYPVIANDLADSAGKLGASRDEIFALLRRCGFELECAAESASERASMVLP